ncbi:MAG: hypothetical protein ACK48M_04435 [Planctomycetia bacterium]
MRAKEKLKRPAVCFVEPNKHLFLHRGEPINRFRQLAELPVGVVK